MNLLIICAHNRFRSKVAETIFLKLNKSKHLVVKSAGIRLDLMNQFISPNVLKALDEKGYQVLNEQSREVNEEDILWADKILIVANNVMRSVFPADKDVEIWEISDCDQEDFKGIKLRVEEIERKVRAFLAKLNL